MRTLIHILGPVIGMILLASCDPDYISDPTDPRLPNYTDIGENTAGAYINGQAWRGFCDFFGNCEGHGLVYLPDTDETIMQLAAGPATGIEGSGVAFRAKITFRIKGNLRTVLQTNPPPFPHLIALDGVLNEGELHYLNTPEQSCTGGVGSLYLRSSYINDFGHVIAGTFGFVTDAECGKITVYQGRFDFSF